MMRAFTFLATFLFLTACAGYKMTNRSNPFSQYGIKTLSIPMFYNHSSFSNVAPIFTQRIHHLLAEFDGLVISSGTKKTDAVLVGIIDSEDKLNSARESGDLRISKSISPNTLGRRGDFYVPATTTNKIKVRFIVIKNPTKAELELLQTPLGKSISAHSKIIFNEEISVARQFNRELFSGDAVSVNYTQNRGAEKENLKQMADSVASTFKEMILYAF